MRSGRAIASLALLVAAALASPGIAAADVAPDGSKLAVFQYGPRRVLLPEGWDVSVLAEYRTRWYDTISATWVGGGDRVLEEHLSISIIDGGADDLRVEIDEAAPQGTSFGPKGWTCATGVGSLELRSGICGRRLDGSRNLFVRLRGNALSSDDAQALVARIVASTKGFAYLPPRAKRRISVPRLVRHAQHGLSFRAPRGWFVFIEPDGSSAEAVDRPREANVELTIAVRSGGQFEPDWTCGARAPHSWSCTRRLDENHHLEVAANGPLNPRAGEKLVRDLATSVRGARAGAR